MPSGYTAVLYEGEQTLRDYLMNIGRGMGFAILQRDEAPGEPVKLPATRDSYYGKALAKAREDLAAAQALTALRSRYEAMVEKVKAWEPDPLIANETSTKTFALEQLQQGLEHDCGLDTYLAAAPLPTKRGSEWRAEFIAKAQRSLDLNTKWAAEEAERESGRQRFIEAFLRSLPED